MAVLLTGCMAQSQIQSQYIDQQDTCRVEASRRLAGNVLAPNADGQASAGLYFSECMNKAGWRVSMPKPAQTAQGPVPNPPTGSPSTNPIAATSAPASAQTIGAISPSEGTATLVRGPHTLPGQAGAQDTMQPVASPAAPSPASGAPSVNPSATPAQLPSVQPAVQPQQASESPAQYLPKPQVNTQEKQRGYGPGRQF